MEAKSGRSSPVAMFLVCKNLLILARASNPTCIRIFMTIQ
jgi:hypothetical protein